MNAVSHLKNVFLPSEKNKSTLPISNLVFIGMLDSNNYYNYSLLGQGYAFKYIPLVNVD